MVDTSTQTPIDHEGLPQQAAVENGVSDMAMENVTDSRELGLLSELCRVFKVTSIINLMRKLCDLISREELVGFADIIFLHLAESQGETCNPRDYVSLSLEAMKTLSVVCKSSLICKFVYALGTKRPASDEPLMPINRMPFGLIQYQIEFFSATNVMQVII